MVKWVTCREPQGRAIGKINNDKEVRDVYKLKTSFENQYSNSAVVAIGYYGEVGYSNIPLFHV